VRRLFQWIARLLVLALLLGVPAILIYLQYYGFSASWRDSVANAISGPGYVVRIGKLTFHPFEGIVAEEAGLFMRRAPGRQLARLDRLYRDAESCTAPEGKVAIDLLDLENASVSIPFADDGVMPNSIELHGISAGILNGNGQLTVTHAECWFR